MYSRQILEEKYLVPQNMIEYHLVKIWENVLGVRPIGIEDDYFKLGGDSLAALDMMAAIEKQFKHRLPISVIYEAPTIAKMSKLINSNSRLEGFDPLLAMQIDGDNLPFFCAHPGGGSSFCYMPFASSFENQQPFYSLQDPMLYTESSLFKTIEEMAEFYLQSLVKVQPKGPYRIGGWSLGGVIAYEMGQQLRKRGEKVDKLILFDSFTIEYINNFPSYEELQSRIMTEIPNINIELVGKIAKVMHYHGNLLKAYKPKKYDSLVILFKPKECHPDYPLVHTIPCNGWSKFTSDNLEINMVNGDHHTMMQLPNVLELVKN